MIVDYHLAAKPEGEMLRKQFHDHATAINGNLEFGDPVNGPVNFKGLPVSLTTPGTADTEFTIVHNLGYIPQGILVFSVDQAAHIYASRRNLWTASVAFFKANQSAVSLTGFVV